MRQPWITLDRAETPDGLLELRRRGERDFLLTLSGRIVMTSVAHRSEDALARLACAAVAGRPRPRVLVSGLGMGYTLRAALDALPAGASVLVAELNPAVVEWCRGPLADLSGRALSDPRVGVHVGDVAGPIAAAASGAAPRFDAIALDLYEGPRIPAGGAPDRVFGTAALRTARAALAEGGVLAVWSEQEDPAFERRLTSAGLRWERHRAGRGGRIHSVYLAGCAPARSLPPPSRRR